MFLHDEKLLFLGDFFYDYSFIADDIEQIAQFVREHNYKVILNYEGSLNGKGCISKRGPVLEQSRESIEVLKRLNVVGVTVANNHTMDCGASGLNRTLAALDAAGIKYAGAGRCLDVAMQPMVFDWGAKKIVIFSNGWDVEETVYATRNGAGCAPRAQGPMLKALAEARAQYGESALIVNCMHWGFEFNRLPMPYDVDLAHSLIDAGSNFIIGHHPHNLQPRELYQGSQIYYSLGNFYMSSLRDSYNREFGKLGKLCDLGLGVALGHDSNRSGYKEHVFAFDRHAKETVVDTKEIQLEDISNIDCRTNEYVRFAKAEAFNNNPILTSNKVANFTKLFMLSVRYFLVRKIKQPGMCIMLKFKRLMLP